LPERYGAVEYGETVLTSPTTSDTRGCDESDPCATEIEW
jgi:hypothetical protein